MINNIDFVHLSSYSAEEFADEDICHLIDDLSCFERKSTEEIEKEFQQQTKERIVENTSHPFQIWMTKDLLERINKIS